MTAVPQRCMSLLSNSKTLRTVKQIHAPLLKTGHSADPFVAGKLLLHCAVTISDALGYAQRLFLHFRNPDVFMYNTLIRGFCESGSPQNSILTFIDMRRRSRDPPDSFSFAFILKAAANYRSFRVGIQLHCQALNQGLDAHLFVATTLISMYAECGSVSFASQVFDEMRQSNMVAWNAVVTAFCRGGDMKEAANMFKNMPFRDMTSWNVMIAGYMKAGELEAAKKAFSMMPEKDGVSWSTMIVGFAHNGYADEAFGYYRELQREGMRPNEVSLTGVLSACAQVGAFEFGKILHGFIEKSGFSWITSVNNALLDTYSKCGNLGMAMLVFKRMKDRGCIIAWTSMIAAMAMHGHGEEAIQLFHEMEKLGVSPDGITFISILYACSHAGLLEQGHHYFSKMKDVYNIEPGLEHYGCVVDLYGRAGKLQTAYEFASQMPVSPNIIIWRTLLGACSMHGNVELAELVKEKLSELDPRNSGDHVLLSNIYAVAGKWKEAAMVRRTMTNQKIGKSPGWSMIEVDKVIFRFVAGEKRNGIMKEAQDKLREIMSRLRTEGGYLPEVSSVLHDIEEEEKEDSASQHSEKLAVAFGLSRMCQGKVIRVVKNLRICRDCHSVFKLISKVYALEIVVRDRSRFHTFSNGVCSCKDYW